MTAVFAKNLNFTIREFKRKDGVWAKLDPITKKWSGMIKNLFDLEADILSGNLCYLRNRAEKVDYLQPMNDINLGFAIRGLCGFLKYQYY